MSGATIEKAIRHSAQGKGQGDQDSKRDMGQWATLIPPKDTADRIADAWGAGCKIDRSIKDDTRVAMSKLVRLSLRATAEEREMGVNISGGGN